MKIKLRSIQVAPLYGSFFTATMEDSHNPFFKDHIEVVFQLDVNNRVMIESVDETLDGMPYVWDIFAPDVVRDVAYIKQRLEIYLSKHPLEEDVPAAVA